MMPCRLMEISVSWSGTVGAGQDPSDRERGQAGGETEEEREGAGK